MITSLVLQWLALALYALGGMLVLRAVCARGD